MTVAVLGTGIMGAPLARNLLKLVLNNWLLAITEAVAGTIALCRGLSLGPHLFLQTLAGSQMDMPYARLKGAAMLADEFRPSFPLRLAEKDLRRVLEAAEEAGLELPVAAAVRRHFRRAIELGHGDEDLAATYFVSARS